MGKEPRHIGWRVRSYRKRLRGQRFRNTERFPSTQPVCESDLMCKVKSTIFKVKAIPDLQISSISLSFTVL